MVSQEIGVGKANPFAWDMDWRPPYNGRLEARGIEPPRDHLTGDAPHQRTPNR